MGLREIEPFNTPRQTTQTFDTSQSPFNPPRDNQGNWSPTFDNGVELSNYATGEPFNTFTNLPIGEIVRSYLTFDLSRLQETVTSAKIQVQRYYGSGDPIETLGIFDVSTDAATLNSEPGINTTIFNDLGTGKSYGTFPVSTTGDPSEILEFKLNSNAIADLNNSGNKFFSVGLSLLNLNRPSNQSAEYLFAFSNSSGVQRLVVETIPKIVPKINLSVAPSSVSENPSTKATYTFTRTGNIKNALTVNFNVKGTALFNSDYSQTGAATYTNNKGSVTFAPNSQTAKIIITPKGDFLVESNETVALSLAAGKGYTIGNSNNVTTTINNNDGGAGNDILIGGTENDLLRGQEGNDTIKGGLKNDWLMGESGNDILMGESGNDTLLGQSGKDRFTFNNPTEGVDFIIDFQSIDDTIAVSAAGFKAGLTHGTLTATKFVKGVKATTANHRFIYNGSVLFFDPDGNKSLPQQAIAQIPFGMTNADILVIA